MRKFVASYAYLLSLMLAVACFVISGRHYGETAGPMLFLVGAIFLVLFMATMPSNGQVERAPEHENREWLLLPADPQEGQIWVDPVSLSYAVRRRYIFTGGAWHPLSATKADLNGLPLPGDDKFPDEPTKEGK